MINGNSINKRASKKMKRAGGGGGAGGTWCLLSRRHSRERPQHLPQTIVQTPKIVAPS